MIVKWKVKDESLNKVLVQLMGEDNLNDQLMDLSESDLPFITLYFLDPMKQNGTITLRRDLFEPVYDIDTELDDLYAELCPLFYEFLREKVNKCHMK